GRAPACHRAAVRAPRSLVDDRRTGAQPPEGIARPLPDGLRGRAGICARFAARSHDRALPGASDAVTVPDAAAFAALICDWCLEAPPADRVLVNSTTWADPVALERPRATLGRDAWPKVCLVPAGLNADFYRHARELHLAEPSPIELSVIGGVDSLVRIDAP